MTMHFTLDGESFELTPELVLRSLEGHAPEDVRTYWVEVDGTRWPVKQVISLATGIANRKRFQSQNSRRLLRNLGFTIGSGSTALATGAGSHSIARSRKSFDLSALVEIEAVDVRVAFSWLWAGPVALDAAGIPRFPPLPRLPGLYRFDFGEDDSGQRTIYIGESIDLARRGSNYRNAKTDRSRQRTSRRIHKEIVGHLGSGGSIEFAIATSIRSDNDEELDLRFKSARRLAENAAVLLAQSRPDVRVLNIDAQPDSNETG